MIIFTIIFSLLFNYNLNFPEVVRRLSVTVFLFSIGLQITLNFSKSYTIRLLNLLMLSIAIITIMDLFSSLMLDHDGRWLFGSMMFAYNQDIVEVIVTEESRDFIRFWGSVQMIIVFLLTPLYLNLSFSIFKDPKSAIPLVPKEKIHIPLTKETLVIFSLSYLFYLASKATASFSFLFLYDFVFSLVAGMIYGSYLVRKRSPLIKQKAELFQMAGTAGLYLFIILSVNNIHSADWDQLNSRLFLLIIFKTILTGVITFIVSIIFFKKWTIADKITATVAGWTFMLNEPVICMHGMRTAVNRLGPAPSVLLVVPPVILWIINYFHLGLLLFL